MASYMAPKCLTFKAAGAIGEGYAVKAGADNQHVQVSTAKTDKSIGIAQNASVNADDKVEIALNGGGAKAKLGNTVSFGDLLAPTTDGTLIATTTAGDRYLCMALEDGIVGDIIAVHMCPGLI